MSETKNGSASPLVEADPNSLELLFERVNAKLIQGLPEAIDDEKDIMPMVMKFREARITFLKEQDKLGRAPSAPRKAKPKGVADAIATTIDESAFE